MALDFEYLATDAKGLTSARAIASRVPGHHRFIVERRGRWAPVGRRVDPLGADRC